MTSPSSADYRPISDCGVSFISATCVVPNEKPLALSEIPREVINRTNEYAKKLLRLNKFDPDTFQVQICREKSTSKFLGLVKTTTIKCTITVIQRETVIPIAATQDIVDLAKDFFEMYALPENGALTLFFN